MFYCQVLTETSYTRSVDWWGLGVLIFEMLVGEVSLTIQLYCLGCEGEVHAELKRLRINEFFFPW